MKGDQLIHKLNQRIPINEIFEEIDDKSLFILTILNCQENLLTALYLISIVNPYYSKCFLSHLFNGFENLIYELQTDDLEFDERFYDFYISILSAKEGNPTDYDIIKYNLITCTSDNPNGHHTLNESQENPYITIRECPRLIGGLGTTGLRTWEASCFLSNFLINPKNHSFVTNIFNNQTVLEIGSGTSLVSLTLYKNFSSLIKKVIITDGDSSLLDNIVHGNLSLNDIQLPNDKIQVQRLLWNDPDDFSSISDFDVIIGSDLTYDRSIIPDLINLLKKSLNTNKQRFALISASVRNIETTLFFENLLTSNNLSFKIIEKCLNPSTNSYINNSTKLWFKKGTFEVRIYKIYSSKCSL
ncbi:protein-lysine N-methyltransferase ASCRUDRAFT_73397 [Ascoidea rubescens DSM 1968]|uniref:S-adenosyl-L-methionine-dependent methyltransferase n=1 Tax=Ascoidea rubescens DSM 1968 TaxID=1344418 RepID=A0A1D2VPP5_9ASCO|nr:hypothetical protein ASCRUDRAFT_73397 [Ascoidea rubescens DSM 1968]ODV63576.1 hypothetical protein ASCRUDRAFT_73397 [Ascoidea rubescens DSM 1968]